MSSGAAPTQDPGTLTPPSPFSGSPTASDSLQPPSRRNHDPLPSPTGSLAIPSPVPTRRTRTNSATVRASEGPSFTGTCKQFSRTKGHGFITPSDGGNDIFVHISDIEGEYVPMEGDELSYKLCSIPPKHEKVQAVEVTIIHSKPGTKHETWAESTISS